MKATIDIPDQLYRKVKAKAAQEGRRIRDVTIEMFQFWVAGGTAMGAEKTAPEVPRLAPAEVRRYKDTESLRRAFPKGYRLTGPLIPARRGAKPLKADRVSEEMARLEQEELNSHVRTR